MKADKLYAKLEEDFVKAGCRMNGLAWRLTGIFLVIILKKER